MKMIKSLFFLLIFLGAIVGPGLAAPDGGCQVVEAQKTLSNGTTITFMCCYCGHGGSYVNCEATHYSPCEEQSEGPGGGMQ